MQMVRQKFHCNLNLVCKSEYKGSLQALIL